MRIVNRHYTTKSVTHNVIVKGVVTTPTKPDVEDSHLRVGFVIGSNAIITV